MAHAHQALAVIDVDANGHGPDGEDFGLVADQDHVDAGYFVNRPVALRFPDGTVIEGNRVLVTEDGRDFLVEEFATPEGKAQHRREKAERERKRAEVQNKVFRLNKEIADCNENMRHVELVWAEALTQAKASGRSVSAVWPEVAERCEARRSRLLWCRVLLEDTQRDPDEVAGWAKEQAEDARAELEAEQARLAELEASPEMAEVQRRLQEYADLLKAKGEEAARSAILAAVA